VLALAVLLGVTGCGTGPTGSVSGKVSYLGNPVKGGNVIFSAQNGKKSVMAPIGEDGSYTVSDVPVGDVKIAVQTKALGVLAATAKISSIPANSPMRSGSKISPEDAARRFVQIPDNYEDTESSGLTYVVQKGSQEHNITLSGKLTPGGGKGGSGGGPKGGSGGGPPK